MPWRPVIMALLVGALAAACSSGGESDSPTAATSTPASSPTPPADRTGILEVDAVLDAIASGDNRALAPLTSLTAVPCKVELMGLDPAPKCLPGEREGSLVEAFPAANCEGRYRPLEREGDSVPAIVGPLTQSSLYAVYRITPTTSYADLSLFTGRFFSVASPRYVVIIARDQGERISGSACSLGKTGWSDTQGDAPLHLNSSLSSIAWKTPSFRRRD